MVQRSIASYQQVEKIGKFCTCLTTNNRCRNIGSGLTKQEAGGKINIIGMKFNMISLAVVWCGRTQFLQRNLQAELN